jgi:nicotinamide riboside kinase
MTKLNNNKICFSGPQCTGKTTLLHYLDTIPAAREYDTYNSPSRDAFNLGFEINNNADNLAQLHIFHKHFENIITASSEKCVYDRCILDAVAYASVSYEDKKISKYVMDYGINLFYELMPHYDIVFYLRPEFDIIADGVRSIDEEYRKRVTQEYDKLINAWQSRRNTTTIVPLTGPVNQRLDIVQTYLVDVSV